MTPTSYEQVFGAAPQATALAPGRVNLLGEHTDYQGGFVLPTAIGRVEIRDAIDPELIRQVLLELTAGNAA